MQEKGSMSVTAERGSYNVLRDSVGVTVSVLTRPANRISANPCLVGMISYDPEILSLSPCSIPLHTTRH